MRRLAFLILFLVGTVAAAGAAEPLRQVRIETPDARSLARELVGSGFDVLEGEVTDGSVDVIVTAADQARLERRGLQLLHVATGRPYREIQAEAARAAVPAGYPDLAAVLARMTAAADSFPAICRFVDLTAELGTPPTFEGRSLYAVKISDNVTVDEDEPSFLLVAAHHCREIVTPLIELHAIEQLTSQYGVDPAITAVVDEHEIWIAPVWNPDGYEYVFAVDNLWRKNRRVFGPDVGVDLNRNYAQGWTNACSGSSTPGSSTYKGPSASSEAETQTLEALTERERFAKVLDHHSSGREILHGYLCWTHPFDAYLQSEAASISAQAGYGAIRAPSADGEHYEWQFGTRSAYAFLMETATTFQPAFSSALAEAAQVWPATLWMLQRPVPLWGHVTDAVTGAPIEADIRYAGIAFAHGETNVSDPATGRYHAFLPAGPYDVIVSAPGYVSRTAPGVMVSNSASTELDFALDPIATAASAGAEPPETRLLFVDPLRLVVGYEVADPVPVGLRIYDVRGALVRTLREGVAEPGRHEVVWNGRNDAGDAAPAGIYLFRLVAGERVHAGKLVRVR